MATAEERKKLAAEQYLAENRIRWLLENVTADLINFAPTRPHPFIVKRVREIQEHGAIALRRRHIIAVIGGPACGKGMTCAHVAQELGTVTVAPAELLRNEVKDGTEIGKRVGELLHANAAVPKEFVTALMQKKLDSHHRGQDGDEPAFVLDGFPRTLEQGLHFESNGTELTKVIYLKAPDTVLHSRLEGGDEARTAAIRDYKRDGIPVVEYYRALGKLVEIDAAQSPEKVMAAVELEVRK